MLHKKILTLLVVFLALVFGSAVIAFSYFEKGAMKCPDRFFDSEKGCQIPVAAEYTPVKAVPVEITEVRDCPDRFFDSEKGCQIPVAAEYTPVKEVPVEITAIRDCPIRFFDEEKGCQIPVIMEYAP